MSTTINVQSLCMATGEGRPGYNVPMTTTVKLTITIKLTTTIYLCDFFT